MICQYLKWWHILIPSKMAYTVQKKLPAIEVIYWGRTLSILALPVSTALCLNILLMKYEPDFNWIIGEIHPSCLLYVRYITHAVKSQLLKEKYNCFHFCNFIYIRETLILEVHREILGKKHEEKEVCLSLSSFFPLSL